ncbi:helix-turn-helix domain-containing protein [Dehalobacter sp. DCA]
MSKGQNVSLDVIEKLCKYLNCQPGDLMEYIPD